jgi:queuosine precursor transporter
MNSPQKTRSYKYYDFVMAAFVCVLISSNVLGAAKAFTVGGFNFTAGVIFFPLSYIFGDILTEVYGYARSRRVVWAGFAALIFVTFISWMVVKLPPAPGYENQAAIEAVFGNTWRIVASSLFAFFCGEFTNSFVLAKMKIWTAGKHLWMRTIGSTVVGEGVDSIIFYPLAFWGVWEPALVFSVMLNNYMLKVLWEVLVTPFTYKVVGFLKKNEQEDFYDTNTDFTPFSIKT